MRNILIIYSTVDGHSQKISQFLSQRLLDLGHSTTVCDIAGVPHDLNIFDQIVLGASIRYGKHNQAVYQFIEQNQQYLRATPSAFFSVNLVARKPEKRSPLTNPYTRKFLSQIAWQPTHAAVFAGRLNYPSYRFWDKQMIRLIMWMTKGPTAPDTDQEFTDWDQVRLFANKVASLQMGEPETST